MRLEAAFNRRPDGYDPIEAFSVDATAPRLAGGGPPVAARCAVVGFAEASESRPSSRAGRKASSQAATCPSCWNQPPRWRRRRLRAGTGQALGAAVRPAAHHLIGDFGVELQANRAPAVAIGLIGEFPAAAGEQFGALGQVEAIRMPLIDAARESARRTDGRRRRWARSGQ